MLATPVVKGRAIVWPNSQVFLMVGDNRRMHATVDAVVIYSLGILLFN
jgi:hypothetical protein